MAIITSKNFNGIQLLKVNSNPSGISSPVGSVALDISTGNKYRNAGGGVWNLIVSGSITEPQTNGTQGPQGNQGIIGSQGAQGTTGDRGPQGVPGTQGSQGLNGDRGLQGNQGSTGSGTQGPQGSIGSGTQGPQGSQGDRGPGGGAQGYQGSQGSTGDRGSQGLQGTQGVQGSQGRTGDQGTQGFQGSTGDRGLQGNQGPQGSTGVGTQGPQGVPGSGGGGGGVGGLPVINVTTDLVGLGYSTNAKADGSESGGDPIQHAIDHFLMNPADFYAIYIPPGVYSISKSLVIAYPPLGDSSPGTFSQCNIISSLNMFPDVGGAAIQWNSGAGKVDPMLVIQGARNVSLSGITFNGPNTAPYDLLNQVDINGHGNHFEALFSTDYADWISSGIRENSRSPQCCVAIDPFLDGYPGNVASNRYPNLTSYYVSKYQRSSSNIVFENCGFRKSAFGIVISPSGPVSGVDVIANAENFFFKNCFFEYNRVHYSTGQSQARANNLFSPRMFGSYIAIDTELVGPGGNNGVAPSFSGAPNIGGCKYVFNINTVNQLLDFSNAYCESVASLGRIDFGTGGLGVRMSGCTFTFISPDESGYPGSKGIYPGVPYHMNNFGMTHLDRCVMHTGNYPLRFWTSDTTRLKLTLCALWTDGLNGKVQAGFDVRANDPSNYPEKTIVIDTALVRPNNQSLMHDDPIGDKTSVFDVGLKTITKGINNTIGTFQISVAAGANSLEVGDLLYEYNKPPEGTIFQPEMLTVNGQSNQNYLGIIGRIKTIQGSDPKTITVDQIYKGFDFTHGTYLRRFRWSA